MVSAVVRDRITASSHARLERPSRFEGMAASEEIVMPDSLAGSDSKAGETRHRADGLSFL